MKSQYRVPVTVLLLVAVTGCRLVGQVAAVPVAATVIVLASVSKIFVSAEGPEELSELEEVGVRVDEQLVEFEINEDLTFDGTITTVTTVTSAAGLKLGQTASLSYDPRTQGLDLVAASVTNPGGESISVSPSSVFERPSEPAQGAPGFVSGMTKTVLFPQLEVGSQTRVEWRFRETAVPALGFSYAWRPRFAVPVEEYHLKLHYPVDVNMLLDTPAPYIVKEPRRAPSGERRRTVIVSLMDYAGQTPQPHMGSPRAACPEVVATTVTSWADIGAAYHAASKGDPPSTEEIEALAEEITAGATGLEAARRIHRWVSTNIEYVVVYLSQSDSWAPHSAAHVLERGYGDCKDKCALMGALLGARGIASAPVLIRQDQGFDAPAVPSVLHFNHCIVYLPEFDLYSNPTDAFAELGQLSVDLSGKFALLAAESSQPTRTPAGRASGNTYSVRHLAELDSTGAFSGTSAFGATGRIASQFRRGLAATGSSGRSAMAILHRSSLGGAGTLSTTDPTQLDVPLSCEGDWSAELRVASGDVMRFVTPTGLDALSPQLLSEYISSGDRVQNLVIGAAELTWAYEIKAPAGYRYIDLPTGVRHRSSAGSYTSSYSASGEGKLLLERTLVIGQDRYSPEEYVAFRELLIAAVTDMREILTVDRSTLSR